MAVRSRLALAACAIAQLRIGRRHSGQENFLKFWGAYKLLVGMVAASESFLGMMRTINGSQESMWGPVTLAAALLLAVEGLRQLFPRIHEVATVVFAGVVPFGVASVFGEWRARLWVFAAVVAFLEWTFQRLERATGREEIGALACGVALAVSLANTTFMLFRLYWDEPQFWPLGQIFRFMLPIALPWTLILILVVHAGREVISGLKREGNTRPEVPSQAGPHSAA